jgi:ubiquitin carboxyl-terminal hydrolase 14
MAMQVEVRWAGNVYKVEIAEGETGEGLKGKLYSLTGVPPERQKVMGAGKGVLRDDAVLSSMPGMCEGKRLMLSGSAEEAPAAPASTKQPRFLEDLPESQQTSVSLGAQHYPAGLTNLGNTCYLNATLQCLRNVDPLRHAIISFSSSSHSSSDGPSQLTHATKELWKAMANPATITPWQLIGVLREVHPQFAQRSQQGSGYMQQDAEEAWSQLLQAFHRRLSSSSDAPSPDPVTATFGVGLEMKLMCEESGEERTEHSTDFSLKCNINNEVNNLTDGLKVALSESRELHSDTLGRNVTFSGQSKIYSLPEYVNIQLVRFFWKQSAGERAKILRAVSFPLELDLETFCTNGLKKELEPARERYNKRQEREAEERKRQQRKKLEERGSNVDEAQNSASVDSAAAAPQSNGSTGAADAKNDQTMQDLEDKGEQKRELTGKYELIAVLTHKGRSADSGHYVAWTKQDDGAWVEYDDDVLRGRNEEELMQLKGGGDHHAAYMLIYKALRE